MKFEEAVARLRFVEKLPLKELGMLGCGIGEDCDGDGEGDMQVQKESDATARTGASFYSCRSSDSRVENGEKMESSWYTCKSKLSNIDKVDAPHHNNTREIHASDNDETRSKLGGRDHHLTSASASSSSSSLPVFTYTPLPRPLPISKMDGASTCSSSSIADFEFTPLPRTDTTPSTSPIQPSLSKFPLRTSSSPFYNLGSFPYERSTSPRTASSIYPSTSTSSGAGPENSHPTFYALPDYSDVESDGSFYRLPQYSDIEDDSFYDEAFTRRKESFGSRASGEVRRPVWAGAVVEEDMAGTGVGRVEDVFGRVEWGGEREVGEIGGCMEGWSGGRWDVVEGRDGEEQMESRWGLGRRATV